MRPLGPNGEYSIAEKHNIDKLHLGMTKTSPLFQKQGKVDKCFVWVMSFFNACYQVVSSFHVLIGAIFFNWKCRHIMFIIQFPFLLHSAIRRADTKVLHLSKGSSLPGDFCLWQVVTGITFHSLRGRSLIFFGVCQDLVAHFRFKVFVKWIGKSFGSISLFFRKTLICPAGKTFISFSEQSALKFYVLIIWEKVRHETQGNFPHVNLTDHKIRSISSTLVSGQPVMVWGPWWSKTWAAGLILATLITIKRSPHFRWS